MVGIDGVDIAELERVGAGNLAGLPGGAAVDGAKPGAAAAAHPRDESVTALTAMRSALVLLTCAV